MMARKSQEYAGLNINGDATTTDSTTTGTTLDYTCWYSVQQQHTSVGTSRCLDSPPLANGDERKREAARDSIRMRAIVNARGYVVQSNRQFVLRIAILYVLCIVKLPTQ